MTNGIIVVISAIVVIVILGGKLFRILGEIINDSIAVINTTTAIDITISVVIAICIALVEVV